ncbi:DUF2637 domain-containing protein [Streptomyces sp. SID13666]|uniref:DUF2637 domain-containing protein n=1 Tax=unclassified Streptomyces TaxID=2593676 RepID=UPI0013C0FACB|nr:MULTISPECIES: DUF2637 domain-containing protein [unclassified Streptomyces]NEA57976.1 DUF2637 domain-containing protein [Streptomyces sp. SID13666]NEA72834.1 DUF2637 domain-containing protein [Streptomyces sp. SID13588]
MTTVTAPDPVQVPPLTRFEQSLLMVATVLGVGVGGTGFALSFDTVTAAAKSWDFTVPQMLPIGIDLAIPTFTVVNLLLIRMDMPLAWVRFVPWFLTGVTCWLNIAAGTSLSARIAHGTMPLLWVVLSEVAAHVYAARIGVVTGRRMEKIRRSRWILAPLSTFALWRRMTLWEITKYGEALDRERERQLLRADLREEHGLRWRSKTPRRTRVLLKLGDATPEPAPADPPAAASAVLDAHQVPAPETASEPPAKARTSRRPAKPAPTSRTWEELLAAARQATAGWPDKKLTADRIRTEIHTSQANARALRDVLKAERSQPLHTVQDIDHPTTETETGSTATDAIEGEAA